MARLSRIGAMMDGLKHAEIGQSIAQGNAACVDESTNKTMRMTLQDDLHDKASVVQTERWQAAQSDVKATRTGSGGT